MKKLLILTTIVFTIIRSQAINWATSFDGAGNDYINDMVTDNSGNTYVIGQFGADMIVNGQTYSPQGLQDMFWAKIGSDGIVDYFHQIGGPGDERGRGIDVDNMGNIYIFGRFTESVNINSGIVDNIGGGINGFVIKYNSSFEHQWFSLFNSFTNSNSGNIYPLDLVANKENGGCYVTFTWDGYISFANTFHSPVDHDGNQIGTDGAVVKINENGTQVGYALVKHESNVRLGNILNRKSIVYGGNGEIYIWGDTDYNSEYYGSLGLGYSGTGNPDYYWPSYGEEFQNNNSQNNSSTNFFLSYDWDGDHPNLNWMGRFDSESRHQGGFRNVSYNDGHLLISGRPFIDGLTDPMNFQIWTNPINQWPPAIIDEYDLFYGQYQIGVNYGKQLGIIDIDVTNNNQPNILNHATVFDFIEAGVVNNWVVWEGQTGDNKNEVIFTNTGYQIIGHYQGKINDVASAGYEFNPNDHTDMGPVDIFLANIDFDGTLISFSNVTNTENTWESMVASSSVGSNYVFAGYLMGQGIYGNTSIGSDIWINGNSNNNNWAGYVFSSGSGSINVVSPNGGETIYTGSNFDITWQSSGDNIASIDIDFSQDNGSNWINIASDVPNTGTYSWSTPNILSSNCLIKISDASSDISDQSDEIFSLSTTIEVLSPNGGEQIVVGDAYNLQWSSNGILESVDIYLSLNGGSSWNVVAEDVVNNGTYQWVVPNNESNACKIKVTDALNSDVFDHSDANFVIYAPSISLSPIAGPFEITQSVDLSWTTVGVVQLVDIFASNDNGFSYDTILTNVNNTNYASFEVPIEYIDDNIIIKVEASMSPSVFDITQSVLIVPTNEPKIFSVADRPNDDGHYVDIVFTRSKYDGSQNGAEIYTIYRQISDGVWQASNSMDASGSTYYNAMGTTFEINNPTSFKIVATMDEGTFESFAFTGTSEDNIAPSVPMNRLAVLSGSNLNLSWSQAEENDFSHYSIYGGEDDNNLELLQNTIQNEIQVDYQNGWTYGVISSDHYGNQSDIGYFLITTTAALENEILAQDYTLIQNFPNPFNPSTRIQFHLPEDNHVNLTIYDLRGNIIKVLNDSELNEGIYTYTWDAKNEINDRVSAGMYIYTIQAGEFRQTRKMVLLK